MIRIYTDGGFSIGSNKGGWGIIVVDTSKPKGEEIIYKKNNLTVDSTNNIMEMTAFLEALKYFKDSVLSNVEICSDSQYVVKGYTEWSLSWKSKGWKKGDGKPLKNSELWKEIDNLRDENVTVRWVKGHSKQGDDDAYYNDIVDGLTR